MWGSPGSARHSHRGTSPVPDNNFCAAGEGEGLEGSMAWAHSVPKGLTGKVRRVKICSFGQGWYE